jgi:hypothetical protein
MKITGGGEGERFFIRGPCILSRSWAKKLVADSLSSNLSLDLAGCCCCCCCDGGGGGGGPEGVCGLLDGVVGSGGRSLLDLHRRKKMVENV